MSDVDPHLENLLAVAAGMRPELRELVLRYVALFAQFDAAYAAAKAAGPGTGAGYHAAMDAEVKRRKWTTCSGASAPPASWPLDPVAQAVTAPKSVDST
jgi:hypothetical protein